MTEIVLYLICIPITFCLSIGMLYDEHEGLTWGNVIGAVFFAVVPITNVLIACFFVVGLVCCAFQALWNKPIFTRNKINLKKD